MINRMSREWREGGRKRKNEEIAPWLSVWGWYRSTPTTDCRAFPTSFPLFLSSRSGGHHPPPSVRILPALSADRPGCYSSRDAMPEATAGSSGKSFLQRARDKVLRWLRRSLRTTHQVNALSYLSKGRPPQFSSRARDSCNRINYPPRKPNLRIPPAVFLQLFSKYPFALFVIVIQWSII